MPRSSGLSENVLPILLFAVPNLAAASLSEERFAFSSRYFPETFKQTLPIAYYLILEDKDHLHRFEKWGALHKHFYGDNIISLHSGEFFASITEEGR